MPKQASPAPRHESLAALRQLTLKAKPKLDKAELAELSVAQLRDELLACDPVNTDWVIQINRVSCLSHALCFRASSPGFLQRDLLLIQAVLVIAAFGRSITNRSLIGRCILRCITEVASNVVLLLCLGGA